MKHLRIALVCTLALAWPLAAQAAGGGGGGGGGGGAGGSEDSAAAARNQDPDYAAGMAARSRQDWKQVADRMGAYIQRQPEDADALNEFGHAQRKLGQLQPALEAYDRALKINPKHRGAREYRGEAYLQLGDVARAEEELKVLGKLCFFPCGEYTDLKRSIGEYKKARQASSGQ